MKKERLNISSYEASPLRVGVRRLPTPQERDGPTWRPMSEAPKDDTVIVARCYDTDTGEPAEWQLFWQPAIHDWDVYDPPLRLGGRNRDFTPTHWRWLVLR